MIKKQVLEQNPPVDELRRSDYFARTQTDTFTDDVLQMIAKLLEYDTNWDEWCFKVETLQARVLQFKKMVQEWDNIVQRTTECVELRHFVSLKIKLLDLQRKHDFMS